jgi:thioredoxin reductase (NADPH)
MIYDLIIIGAGPAGLTASIYASRYKINHAVIGEVPGGLISEAHNVCNFPGEIEISGFDLMTKIQTHAQKLGAEIMTMEKISKIEQKDDNFNLITESKKILETKNILLATGTKRRQLNLPEEKKYLGKGLAYCATCDAMFYKNKIVGVVGGGNSALTSALYLSEVAEKVYLIVKGSEFNGEMVWVEHVLNNKKIEVIFDNGVEKLNGENKLESIDLSVDYQNNNNLKLDGLFVEIGTEPDKLLIEQLGLITDKNYIVVDKEQKTNRSGVWAAGDITTNSAGFRQVITACSEGAVATFSIFSELQKHK